MVYFPELGAAAKAAKEAADKEAAEKKVAAEAAKKADSEIIEGAEERPEDAGSENE